MMRFLVVMLCKACNAHVKTVLPGEPCDMNPNDHAHFDGDHPLVKAWWSAHYAPDINVLGVQP